MGKITKFDIRLLDIIEVDPIQVSVIIPCFNVDEFIKRCLVSVFEQTYRSIEVICINDGSSDDTLKVLKEVKKESPFPFQVINQKNSGAPSARNKGLAVSSGDYIQFLDADDELKPEKISEQVSIIYANQFPSIVIGPYIWAKIDGSLKEIQTEVSNVDNIWMGLMKSKLGITSSILWNKKVLLNIHGWNCSLKSSQEYELLFRVLKANSNISFSNNYGTVVYQRKNSISNTNQASNWEGYIKLRLEIRDYVKNSAPEKYHEQGFNQIIFDSIRTLHKHNKQLALSYYNSFIPKSFKPKESETTSKRYLRMYNVFGFELAERIKEILTRETSI